jgi:hypothetical protein
MLLPPPPVAVADDEEEGLESDPKMLLAVEPAPPKMLVAGLESEPKMLLGVLLLLAGLASEPKMLLVVEPSCLAPDPKMLLAAGLEEEESASLLPNSALTPVFGVLKTK